MGYDNRRRLFALVEILNKYSDEHHPISTSQLLSILKNKYGLSAYRTTVSDDINFLQDSGMDIVTLQSTANLYYLASREFEPVELKLLIDAVESSKFITPKKTAQITEKLANLASQYDAEELKKGTRIEGRVKYSNEKVFYIVDAINNAIQQGNKISIEYIEYDINKNIILRNDGNPYIISPYALCWNNQFYYLLGYSDKHEAISSFRIDRIHNIPVILNEKMIPAPDDFNISDYSKSTFGMYNSQSTVRTELRCHVSVMKNIIDKFGTDVKTEPIDTDYFAAYIDIMPSPVFFSWVFTFSDRIRIVSPNSVVEQYAKMLETALNSLKTNELYFHPETN